MSRIATGTVTISDVKDGVDGNDAAVFRINNSFSVFSKNKNGDISPSNIELTTHFSNISEPTYQWYRRTGNDGIFSIISGSTSESYSIQSSDYSSYISNAYKCVITGTINGESGQTLEDVITVPLINDGTDSLSYLLSNENITFSASSTGYSAIDFTGGDCSVKVYQGSNELTYSDIGGNGTFSISMASSFGVTLTNTNSTINKPTAMSSDNAMVEFNINVTNFIGDTTSVTKKITYSLSRKGDTGESGVDGYDGPGFYRKGIDNINESNEFEWLDSAANIAANNNPVYDDVVTLYQYNDVSKSITKKYDGSSWVESDFVIHGDMIATGTIRTEKVSVNELSAINANLGTITTGTLKNETFDDDGRGMKLDLVNGVIKIGDTLNGDHMVATKNSINFYTYFKNGIGGTTRRKYNEVRRTYFGFGKSGTEIILNGYWKNKPEIFISPGVSLSYMAALTQWNQMMLCYAQEVNRLSEDQNSENYYRWKFKPISEVSSPGASIMSMFPIPDGEDESTWKGYGFDFPIYGESGGCAHCVGGIGAGSIQYTDIYNVPSGAKYIRVELEESYLFNINSTNTNGAGGGKYDIVALLYNSSTGAPLYAKATDVIDSSMSDVYVEQDSTETFSIEKRTHIILFDWDEIDDSVSYIMRFKLVAITDWYTARTDIEQSLTLGVTEAAYLKIKPKSMLIGFIKILQPTTSYVNYLVVGE